MTDEVREDLAQREWTYAGQRVGADGKLYDVWHDAAGVSHHYSKRGGFAVGSVYRVWASEDGSRAQFKDAPWVRRSDDERRSEWDAEHRAAQTEIEARRAEKRVKQERPIGGLTLEEVRNLMRARLPHQRAGLLAAVIEYVGGGR